MVARPNSELIAIEQASLALEQAKTLDEIKEIRDKAEAVRKYAQSAALGLNAQNHAAEVKLRAERKAGQLLARLPLRGGDRKSNNRRDCLKLEDLGISQNQSTRWQLQSKVPERAFEEYLQFTRESGREISTTGVLRLARQIATNSLAKPKFVVEARDVKSHPATNSNTDNLQDEWDLLGRIGDGLTELSHHRGLLSQLLEPLYSGKEVDLLPAQRRVLGHILREMQILIESLQQQAQQRQLRGVTQIRRVKRTHADPLGKRQTA
jgi:hypothetical protein